MKATIHQLDGVYRNGLIDLEGTPDWAEGTEVVVKLAEASEPGDIPFKMMTEEEWPTTPEGIAALNEVWALREALEFTPEEEIERAAWKEKMKQFNLEAVRKQMGLPE